jgi:hypothetical protein
MLTVPASRACCSCRSCRRMARSSSPRCMVAMARLACSRGGRRGQRSGPGAPQLRGRGPPFVPEDRGEPAEQRLRHLVLRGRVRRRCPDDGGRRARERLYVGMPRATDELVVVGDPELVRRVAGDDVAKRLGIDLWGRWNVDREGDAHIVEKVE